MPARPPRSSAVSAGRPRDSSFLRLFWWGFAAAVLLAVAGTLAYHRYKSRAGFAQLKAMTRIAADIQRLAGAPIDSISRGHLPIGSKVVWSDHPVGNMQLVMQYYVRKPGTPPLLLYIARWSLPDSSALETLGDMVARRRPQAQPSDSVVLELGQKEAQPAGPTIGYLLLEPYPKGIPVR